MGRGEREVSNHFWMQGREEVNVLGGKRKGTPGVK